MEFELYMLWALVPFAVTLLLLKPIWRAMRWIVGVLLLGLLLGGCGTTSNRFEKSPCACDFQKFDVDDDTEVRRG